MVPYTAKNIRTSFSVESFLALNQFKKKSCYGLDHSDLPECCYYLRYQYCLVSVETIITVLTCTMLEHYSSSIDRAVWFTAVFIKWMPARQTTTDAEYK